MQFLRPSRSRSGFSLIELLVVIAILGIVAAFTIPAATTMIRGSQLSQGAQVMNDQLNYARQLAIARSRPIEVRFYRFADPETPGEDPGNNETWKFRAMQTFEVVESGVSVPVGRVIRLPQTVIMNRTEELSTLLGDSWSLPYEKPNKSLDPEIPGEIRVKGELVKVGHDYEFMSFRFQPDGSTNLPLITGSATNDEVGRRPSSGGRWYITLHGSEFKDTRQNVDEINFYTIQVDPATGNVRSYRPNAS